jgi:transketolase
VSGAPPIDAAAEAPASERVAAPRRPDAAAPPRLALAALPRVALAVREQVVRLATGGGCFLGASLSVADLLVHLYGRVLAISPEALDDPGRDYLFLSKGHDVPALYATLAELGFLDRARLANHLSPGDSIYWHPSRAVPGVEFHSGSLGHLLAVALGVAYDIRLRGGGNRVFVILGDGELDEGSVWEACLVAAALGLDNLTAIVDRNGFQANLPTEELVPLEPLPAKLRAFGWSCWSADGHSFDDLEAACRELPFAAGRPSAIVARTVRGKGLASLEGRADRWFADLSAAEVEALVAELHGARAAELATPGRLVR